MDPEPSESVAAPIEPESSTSTIEPLIEPVAVDIVSAEEATAAAVAAAAAAAAAVATAASSVPSSPGAMAAAAAANAVKKYHLVVRCFGLHVSQDASFKNLGTFKSLFLKATTSNVIKNEKRVIKISQSAPFKPPGRPPSLIYENVYESEVFEDNQDVNPSLVADISCPEDKDCKVQINVYYSSNRTGGKSILLCGTTFNLRDIFRFSEKGVFMTPMTSEYCNAAKAYLELFEPFPPVLTLDSFGIQAPVKVNNPLSQKYTFYSDDDNTSPSIDVLELIWEPRLAFQVPEQFLDNTIACLERSILAWKNRYHLERMRQGKYYSSEEALKRGWSKVRICIHSSVLYPVKATLPDRSQAAAKNNAVPYSYYLPLATNLSAPSSFSGPPARFELSSPGASRKLVSASSKEKVRRTDDFLPSTFVRVQYSDRTLTFVTPIGRTNVEYYTFEARYGSNAGASSSKKPNRALPASDSVVLQSQERSFAFKCVEAFNPPIPKEVLGLNSEFSAGDSDEQPSQSSFDASLESITVPGEEYYFEVYVPNLINASLEFEICHQEAGFTGDSFGMATLPLDRDVECEWLPLILREEGSKSFERGFVNVSISILDSKSFRESANPAEFLANSNLTAAERTVEFQSLTSYVASLPPNSNIPYSDAAILRTPLLVPSTYSQVCLYDRGICGIEVHNQVDVNDYRHILADCYEWLWYLGYRGYDPLGVLPKDEEGLSLDASAVPKIDRDMFINRVDTHLDLSWINNYIHQLQALTAELAQVKNSVLHSIRKEKTFRPSALKKELEMQPLPINLHYQFFVVRKHGTPTLTVDSSITCGSMSPHGLGHKHGGLYAQESVLLQARQELERLKTTYRLQIRAEGFSGLSRKIKFYSMLEQISQQVTSFESSILQVAKRRIYAVSQALSIAINALHLKLAMVAEGHLEPIFAEQWLANGFLVVFQGLLSVTGHEKSMLEDTIVAIDTLKVFQARILPLVEEEVPQDYLLDDHDLDEIKKNSASTRFRIFGREVFIYLPQSALDKLPESYRLQAIQGGAVIKLHSVLFSQGIDMQQSMANTFTTTEIAKGSLFQFDVNMKGFAELNNYCYAIQPISQSFDISSPSSISSNDKNFLAQSTAFTFVSSYSAQFVPSASNVHPLLSKLRDSINNNNANTKNVELLAEIERLALMLGCCKVTFCKSGKDRTGMVVTFDNARQLSERFAVGNTLDSIIANANKMRLHGCRINIAEKNIGRKVFSFNMLQVQFLPVIYRPPASVCEDILKKDNS